MRGVYLSQDLSHAVGIQHKIEKQVEQFNELGAECVLYENRRRTFFTLIRNLLPFFSKQYFNTKINWKDLDFVYIRKGAVIDKSVVKLVQTIKRENPQIKILFEVPTYPYMDEFPSLIRWLIRLKENQAVPKLSQYIDRVVTYSDDEKIFDIPSLNISNAYDFGNYMVLEKKNDDRLNLIAVASLEFYHGYDRLIQGLINYYKSNNQSRKVTFTLLGDGSVLKSYKEMIAKSQAESYIFLEGRKAIGELNHYYQKADIAVDSLGRHRSQVFYNSTLKGKEYLSKGLPIVSGVKTDLDLLDCNFYFRVPADDSAINIHEIIDFYDGLLVGSSREEVSKEIFDFGKENFSFSATLSPIVDYIKESN